MHGQSYGFNAYFEGDIVAFAGTATVERFARATIRSVIRISNRILEIRFDRSIPANMELNHDYIENMTCTPEVEIYNSCFTRIGTRSTLVTTPRKVMVESNTHYKAGMGAILIEAGAEGWYESGPVKDVWIRGNALIGCAYNGGPEHAVTAIHPSNKVTNASYPVHQNARVENNILKTFDCPVLYAKSMAGLLFKNNAITRTRTFPATLGNPYTLYLNGCKNTVIEGTVFGGRVLERNIETGNMERNHLKTAPK